MVLADHEIKRLAEKFGMLDPFTSEMVKIENDRPVLGYGLDSAGYDLRLADGLEVFTYGANGGNIIDPKNFNKKVLATLYADEMGRIPLPPGTTGLGRARERIKMPNNVNGLVIAKSTYARCAVSLNATKLVPGWEGDLVLEITNQSPMPVYLYANEGIASVLFFWVNPPDALYADRGGSYHKQIGVALPRT